MRYSPSQYRSYIRALKRRRRGRRAVPWGFAALLLVFLGAYAVLQASNVPSAHTLGSQESRLEVSPLSEHAEKNNNGPASNPAARNAWEQDFGSLLEKKQITVSAGDTLINILHRAGLASPEAYQVVRELQKSFDPAKLRQGHELTLSFVNNQENNAVFQGLSLRLDVCREVQVTRRVGHGFQVRELAHELRTRPARAEAEITSSLYQAAQAADLPTEALLQVLRAYSYDVDFQRDIRPGDRIEVLYQERVDDRGKVAMTGPVMYAALHTNGRTLRIYRHECEDGGTGFFDGRGKSVQKALMVTPVEGASASSGYGMRKHPILGYNKMHEGLDFAAPSGTPIMAAGDGVVEYAGPRGSYGHYIRIRHPNQYQTVYAHMSGYVEGISRGARVKQGEVIGYVGSTGRSTGPHLHYEVRYAGSPVNPKEIDSPPGRKLEGEELQRFMASKNSLEELYASLGDDKHLARADEDSSGKLAMQ
ncbi:MAG: M23 family metallopeptidase [Desulfobacterales bacterium]|nr:M23 family metallopeptidase [Desulfobacterales bacterium]